jgi:hypothetical protein
MSQVSTIEKPATVTDEPTINREPQARHIEARWPLRAITSRHEGDGTEYAVLSVSHRGSSRAYSASLNREEHFGNVTRCLPFDAARVGGLIPVARYAQKSLEAAFNLALETLRKEIADGDQKLAAYFIPSEGEAY